MNPPRFVAVIDIGKTNAKVALVDLVERREVTLRRTANAVLGTGPYPHHDAERLWAFILDSLAEIHRTDRIEAISVTTHGATAALLDAAGGLALPMLDYESDGPRSLGLDYDAVRPPFAESGTPRLPQGLNLGAQLFWQERTFPTGFAQVSAILTYPQYWGLRLTGIAACDVTSLGCHTDLWNPHKRDFSSMVDRLGWRHKMAPLRAASDRLGPILPAISARTGLAPTTPVLCGLHDSNASLLPHLLSRRPPFSVVSTGTWVVAMAIGAKPSILDPQRDTLINVNAFGDSVPSARFMGGREFAVLTEGLDGRWTDEDVDAVLAKGLSLLPATVPGCGPFPTHIAAWISGEGATAGERFAAISFYLALMTATCLDLIGADGVSLIEGPFAHNSLCTRMLAAATKRTVLASTASTGTSIGAAMLVLERFDGAASGTRIEPPREPAYQAYAGMWMKAAEGRGAS